MHDHLYREYCKSIQYNQNYAVDNDDDDDDDDIESDSSETVEM